MKYKILIILFLFITIALSSFRIRDIYAEFINEVRPDFVPSDFTYFFLIDSATPSYGQSLLNPQTIEQITKIDTDFADMTAADFVNDTFAIDWHQHKIDMARIISKDSIENYHSSIWMIGFMDNEFYTLHKDSINSHKPFNKIFIPCKEPRNKKKRNRLLQFYSDSLERSIPKEWNKIYTFYKPTFSQNLKYAFFQVSIEDRGTVLYLYKHQNNKWKRITELFSYQ